ncbi:hypothetical protein B9Z55_026139 [Caenorhabditis nigoni]|uniref:DUF38 domain-containing protein n=1 Tax=Caenorhabditis nigoni TaxID=1611254 RepID=A0A2G5T234_9PELO|nr:hypothetical protein B9Z55_026139 [Caenorhabditis nigoni]
MNRDSSPPNLDTIPLKGVLNYLNLKERSVLRKVNRALREAVDSNCTTVSLNFDFCHSQFITLNLDDIEIVYCSDGVNQCEMLVYQKRKTVKSGYVETVKKDLGIYFKNPNTRITNLKLQWDYDTHLYEGLCQILETIFDELSQNGLGGLRVETLELYSYNGAQIARLLRLIDVNTINSLRLDTHVHLYDGDQFVNLPQWERVRDFQLVGSHFPHKIFNVLGNVTSFNIKHENGVDLEIIIEPIYLFVSTVLNPSENFQYGQITCGNIRLLDIPFPMLNTSRILGNVSVTIQRNTITMEKLL